jgi:hypothetical protein
MVYKLLILPHLNNRYVIFTNRKITMQKILHSYLPFFYICIYCLHLSVWVARSNRTSERSELVSGECACLCVANNRSGITWRDCLEGSFFLRFG